MWTTTRVPGSARAGPAERRNAGETPGPRAVRAELMLWNGGTATVAIADLPSPMVGVLAGSVLLVIALVLFAGGFR